MVGRNPDMHYVLDSSTVGNFLMSCSRKHFGIYKVETKVGHHVVSIRDYSNTATFINGVQIGQNASRPLSDGDKIALGKSYYESKNF
jgi:pSer/pThr/pTyr-binding forkhead associated (FHA) protein